MDNTSYELNSVEKLSLQYLVDILKGETASFYVSTVDLGKIRFDILTERLITMGFKGKDNGKLLECFSDIRIELSVLHNTTFITVRIPNYDGLSSLSTEMREQSTRHLVELVTFMQHDITDLSRKLDSLSDYVYHGSD